MINDFYNQELSRVRSEISYGTCRDCGAWEIEDGSTYEKHVWKRAIFQAAVWAKKEKRLLENDREKAMKEWAEKTNEEKISFATPLEAICGWCEGKMIFDSTSYLTQICSSICLECVNCSNVCLIDANGPVKSQIARPKVVHRVMKFSKSGNPFPSLWIAEFNGDLYEIIIGPRRLRRSATAHLGRINFHFEGLYVSISWPLVSSVKSSLAFLGEGFGMYGNAPEFDPEGSRACIFNAGWIQSSKPKTKLGQFLADATHPLYWVNNPHKYRSHRSGVGGYLLPFWFGKAIPFSKCDNLDAPTIFVRSLIRRAVSED